MNFAAKRFVLILAAGAILIGPSVPAARAAETEVTVDNFSFHPDKLTVKSGTTIVFRNRDDIPHTIASAGGAFHSGALDTDDTFSFTFETPGAFPYFCSLHPKMTGEIVVTP
jgi:plastocyanin